MKKEDLISAKDRQYYLLAFKIIADLWVVIFAPVVVLAYLGRYLDEKFGFSFPYLTIFGFILAAFITVRLVLDRTKKYAAEYETLNKEGDRKPPQNDITN
jgi:hypothetical protein